MSLTAKESSACERVAARAGVLLDDLAAHVAIPTGTGHASGIDAYRALLLGRLEALGGTTRLVPGEARPAWLRLPRARDPVDAPPPPTAIVSRRGRDGPPAILLAGHLDTVHDPHGAFRTLTVSSDGLTAAGPGAADMKGGILIAVAALECLAEEGHDLGWTFVLNADEEIGSFQSAAALREAAVGHRIGLALEPALPDGSLVIERMGTGMFRIDAHGRAAHVGREFARGASAVYALARAITRIEGMVDLEAGRILNIGPIEGGSVVNAVPDHAAAWGNVRFRDAATQQALEKEVLALATRGDDLPSIEVHTTFNRPAKPFTAPVQRLAHAIRAAAEDLGQAMPFASTGGVCDGNILQEAGLATLDTLGVRGGNLHRNDEYIEVASLVDRCQLLAVLLLRLAADSP